MTSNFFAALQAAFGKYDVVHFHEEASQAIWKAVRSNIHGECEIIRGCHNRDKGTAENERLRNPKFIFSYPKNERMTFLNGRNAAQKEISTMRVG